MNGSKKRKYYWLRFIFPDGYEKDPEFRDYLARLSRPSMFSAGMIAIFFPIVHLGVYTLIYGQRIAWICTPKDTSAISIGDKLLVIFLGAVCVVFSRIHLRPQTARIALSFLALSVAMVSFTEDIFRRNLDLSPAYFVLIMVVLAGSMPYRPWQVFILGAILLVLFNVWPLCVTSLFGTERLIPKTGASVLLALSVFLCTVVSAIIYRSRFRLFRSRQKEKILRDQVSRYASELEETNFKLRETREQLVQSEKMAALGNLVAGVAHEINTPLGAVNSMYDSLSRSLKKIKDYMESEISENKKTLPKIDEAFRVFQDSDWVIRHGIDRVANIVNRLRSFARLDEADLKKVDIHECIEDTLVLLQHELKKNIEVVKNFGDVPPIACYPGRLNQVFLNLLVNSRHAILEKGTIKITTFTKNNNVHILFTDDGIGISKENLPKIFDPGFTTKGSGVGTGLGLSISYKIIENHKGEMRVESEQGKGSTFTIILPMNLEDLIKTAETSDEAPRG